MIESFQPLEFVVRVDILAVVFLLYDACAVQLLPSQPFILSRSINV